MAKSYLSKTSFQQTERPPLNAVSPVACSNGSSTRLKSGMSCWKQPWCPGLCHCPPLSCSNLLTSPPLLSLVCLDTKLLNSHSCFTSLCVCRALWTTGPSFHVLPIHRLHSVASSLCIVLSSIYGLFGLNPSLVHQPPIPFHSSLPNTYSY